MFIYNLLVVLKLFGESKTFYIFHGEWQYVAVIGHAYCSVFKCLDVNCLTVIWAVCR